MIQSNFLFTEGKNVWYCCADTWSLYTPILCFQKICLNLIVGLRQFLNMNKIQVDFAGDIIFRSGEGKSVNDYSNHVSDIIHFN